MLQSQLSLHATTSTIVNSAAMNIGVPVSLSVLVSSVCMPNCGIAGSYGSYTPSLFVRLFQLEANYFMILWRFLPYIDMNQPQVNMCPPAILTPYPTSLPTPFIFYFISIILGGGS